MNGNDFRDYLLSFLFLRYLSDNYEAAAQNVLGKDYPELVEKDKHPPLSIWYAANKADVPEFEKQMHRKVHYVIEPQHLWSSIAEMARMQNGDLLRTLQEGFLYIENQSFYSSFRACFPRSILIQKSSVKIIPNAIQGSAPLLQKLQKK